MQKLPVTIISGFLGAGKTTLLNALLAAPHGLRIAVLVNDFGRIEVDSQLIRNIDGQTIALANGCVCCTIRADLVQALEELLERETALDQIVIETSGVSDPAAAAMTLVMSTRLASRLRLAAIITVVDAENLLALQGEHKALATDQLQAADIVLLNKCDLVGPEQLRAVSAWIEATAPRARLLATEQARAPVELLFDAPGPSTAPQAPRALAANPAAATPLHSHPHEVTHWSWQERAPLALEPLYQLLQQLPRTVFRAKGILHLAELPERRVVLQVVGSRVQLSKGEPWGSDEIPASRLVMLGLAHSFGFAPIAAALAQCVRSARSPAANAPAANRFLEAVINVLRAP